MLRLAAAGAVGAYQRHISPHKGFCCAYRAHTGRVSCSEFGRRVILKLGLGAFFRLMPRQFARCRSAYAAILAHNPHGAGKGRRKGRLHRALDRCDCGDCGSCGDIGDCAPDGCDLPCDCSC
jgi:putative component of membrane protein insertase Oxa1/YidC/SpoIIIJ protein YidD